MRVFVEGIGVLGPGLNGWQASRRLWSAGAAYARAPTVVPASDLLPPAERRRIGLPVKLALAVGREAFEHAARDFATTATVFTSSSGDGENLHQICAALAAPEREISPTRFHNSVHNAPAGYWSIATRSHESSTSLCCYDASFAAGLLDAVVQVAVESKAVALIACDQPYPQPLHAVRAIDSCFGVAVVVTPQTTERAFATLAVDLIPGPANATRMAECELEALRGGIPAARSLPLLAALARGTTEVIVLDHAGGSHLQVTVAPCG